MLRIAVPNKGVLSEPAAEMLAESGYRQRRSTKELAVYDPDNDTEFFYLRPARHRRLRRPPARSTSASPGATCCSRPRRRRRGTPRSRSCRWASAARRSGSPRPVESGIDGVDQLAGKRIATAYPVLLQRYLDERGIKADVIRLDGAVETAVPARRRRRGLRRGRDRDDAARGRAADHRRAGAAPARRCWSAATGAEEIPAVAQLRRRLQGVIVARQLRAARLRLPERAARRRPRAITPGLECPTVSPLQTPGWSAVRAMVRADRDQPDHGRALGARRPRHPGHQHPRLPHLNGTLRPRPVRRTAACALLLPPGWPCSPW